ncbi:MAG: hypothetical protein HYS13_08930 [Planctomycetia bacterium]|nr:hypothetical protein [Planctomycetia bacterium]
MNFHNPESTLSVPPPPGVVASAENAVARLRFVVESYSLRLNEEPDLLKHDLAVMRWYGDLARVGVELLAADGTLLLDLEIAGPDSSCEFKTPVLPKTLRPSRYRLIFCRAGRERDYLHLLKFQYGNVTRTPRPAGDELPDGAAATLFVASDAKRLLEVTRRGALAFGFAKDLESRTDGIHFLTSDLPPGIDLQPGDRMRAVVFSGPHGLHARAIERA